MESTPPHDPRSDETLEEERVRRLVAARMFGRETMPRIDRFTVLERVGSGAMGTVFAVYDARLDRKVALKLLRPSSVRTTEERLLREGRALARLSHPNVVPLFEVGTHEGRVFLAMEFVQGQTLSAWLAAARPSWREIVAVYQQAGAALAAAHAVGIVHRDFKPDNALLGNDGRVRVVDFGLARPHLESGGTAPSPARASELDTSSGIAGTPTFMAPEQTRGEAVDARADQFAFAVALHRALYRRDPFGDAAGGDRLARIDRNEVEPAPRDARVPEWVRAVVLRGLRARPDERFTGMTAMLGALAADPARRRKRTLALVGVVAVAIAGSLLATQFDATAALCDGADNELAGVWDEVTREQVQRALLATGVSYAAESWAQVGDRLDRRADAWRAGHRDACEATNVRREASADALDLRMACLHGVRRELSATVDLLRSADADVVEHAVQLVADLPASERCADLDWLRADPSLREDPARRPEIARLRDTLAQGRALRTAGKFREARETIESGLARAERVAFEPLVAEYLVASAATLLSLGDAKAADAEYKRAYLRASASGHDGAAAEAATGRLYVLGVQLAQFERADDWAELTEAAIDRLGARGDRDRASLAAHRGSMLSMQGKYAEAAAMHQEALARLRASDPNARSLATFVGNLSQSLVAMGEVDAAIVAARESVALSEQTFGAAHPYTGRALGALAIVQARQHDHEQSIATFERALSVLRAALGDEHDMVAQTHLNLGQVMQSLGRMPEAESHLRRAVEIFDDPDRDAPHPLLSSVLSQLGGVLLERDEVDDAIALLERAHAIGVAKLGAEHPSVAKIQALIGRAQAARGRHADALASYRSALAVLERAMGREHEDVADMLDWIGLAAAREGRVEEARAAFERALEIYEHNRSPRATFARVGLGRLLGTTGERARALDLLERAVADCGGDRLPPSLCEEARAELGSLRG